MPRATKQLSGAGRGRERGEGERGRAIAAQKGGRHFKQALHFKDTDTHTLTHSLSLSRSLTHTLSYFLSHALTLAHALAHLTLFRFAFSIFEVHCAPAGAFTARWLNLNTNDAWQNWLKYPVNSASVRGMCGSTPRQ